MKYARIITDDNRFKKMLSLEMQDIGVNVITNSSLVDTKSSLVYTVADLDCFDNNEISDFSQGTVVIGFSRKQADEIPEKIRLCNCFFHRPFLMSDFLGVFESDNDVQGLILPKNNYTHTATSTIQGKINRLYINDVDKTAIFGNHKIHLSINEYKVLSLLYAKRGELVLKCEIDGILGVHDGNMGDVYICHLRCKLDNVLGVKFIYTVRGKGYIFKN